MGWVDSISRVVMPGGVMYLQKEKSGHIYNTAPVTEIGVFELSKIFLKNTIL